MAARRKAKPRGKDSARHPKDFAEESQLNDRQALFVRLYAATLNGTRSAIAAGYSARSAAASASTMLRLPKIRTAIDEALKEKAMSADEVLARMSDIARLDYDVLLNDRGVIDIAAAKQAGLGRFIRKVTETKDGGSVELLDPQAALVKLGERHRLWGGKLEITGKDGGVIQSEATVNLVGLAQLTPEQRAALRSTLVSTLTGNGHSGSNGNGNGNGDGADVSSHS